ncbi:Asp-tRNA(Asn)/Glu-tRNA(Gln) amidotransferase subunit GatB, partial [Candidatus Dojkabacteria bacterium]|nr:Asp-tRNA(Asn)/Glu-tRNA(Gln) amidotransferase subunit GatB [Candidatus Dojkabacteria bacterium]
IITNQNRAHWFEEAIKDEKDYETIALFGKWFIRDVLGMIKNDKIKLKDLKFNGKDLFELVQMIRNGELTGTLAKQVLDEMDKTGAKPKDIIEKKGLKLVSDEGELETMVDQVLKDNSKVLADINKNPNISKFILGQVMKLTKGKADPQKAMKLIESKLLKE